ncbi:MAG: lipopolysaccharide biosynthesis protein, partial [Phocaeicola sp.]|nr:lipopolysaccharide biosynthesis protein [Phocaeicola sp.]
GQKKYPIRYDLRAIGKYVALALVLYVVAMHLPFRNILLLLAVRTLLLALFVAYIVKADFPLRQIPFINRYIKK